MTANATIAGNGPDGPLASGHAQPITLALQGGGSLSAFAWGVLDRLLDVSSLRIEVVSGAALVP